MTRSPKRLSRRAFDAIDLAATALFGLEGAAAAAHAGLDLLGVIVVGFMVALVGGIVRDVLLGDLPPAALRSPSRVVAALAAALAAFIVLTAVDQVPPPVLVTLDAAGLALFAVTGAEKAWAHGMNLWVITLLGGVTATAGGVMRDVVLVRLPLVFTESVYATAAIAGALVTGIVLVTSRRVRWALAAGFIVTFVLRLVAVAADWQLPRIG